MEKQEKTELKKLFSDTGRGISNLIRQYGDVLYNNYFLPILQKLPTECFTYIDVVEKNGGAKRVKGIIILEDNDSSIIALASGIYSFKKEPGHGFKNKKTITPEECFERREAILETIEYYFDAFA